MVNALVGAKCLSKNEAKEIRDLLIEASYQLDQSDYTLSVKPIFQRNAKCFTISVYVENYWEGVIVREILTNKKGIKNAILEAYRWAYWK